MTILGELFIVLMVLLFLAVWLAVVGAVVMIWREVYTEVFKPKTRSEKMREAGFTRRPTWRSLPKDGDN